MESRHSSQENEGQLQGKIVKNKKPVLYGTGLLDQDQIALILIRADIVGATLQTRRQGMI